MTDTKKLYPRTGDKQTIYLKNAMFLYGVRQVPIPMGFIFFKNPKFHYIIALITSPCYYFHTSSVNCVCSGILLLFSLKSKRYSE